MSSLRTWKGPLSISALQIRHVQQVQKLKMQCELFQPPKFMNWATVKRTPWTSPRPSTVRILKSSDSRTVLYSSFGGQSRTQSRAGCEGIYSLCHPATHIFLSTRLIKNTANSGTWPFPCYNLHVCEGTVNFFFPRKGKNISARSYRVSPQLRNYFLLKFAMQF